MTKVRTVFACQACGFESSKWLGRCPDCGEWNSLVEERQEVAPPPGPGRPDQTTLPPSRRRARRRFDAIDSGEESRVPSGIDEFDRVLGGGIVPGSLVLIGGEPGIGKTTLLLQVAHLLGRSARHRPLRLRRGVGAAGQAARRSGSGSRAAASSCWPRPRSSGSSSRSRPSSPGRSWSTRSRPSSRREFPSAPGSISQVREVATQLLFLAKGRGITIFLIGHVTKDGSDRRAEVPRAHRGHRPLLRGREAAAPPDRARGQEPLRRGLRARRLRDDRGRPQAGGEPVRALPLRAPGGGRRARPWSCTIEGSRPMLVEVQALVSPTSFGTPRRMSLGIDPNRTSLLLRRCWRSGSASSCSATTCS